MSHPRRTQLRFRRGLSVAALLPLLALPRGGSAAGPAAPASALAAAVPPAACPDDFDFWLGDWDVRQEIRTGGGEWESYPARSTVRRAADGCALVEDWRGTVRFFWEGMREPEPLAGLSVRAFDPAAGRWRIHWLDSRSPRFGEPYEGTFADGTGTFVRRVAGADGAEHLGRIRFFDIRPDAVEWELAVSGDDGVSWTPLWRMHFRRASDGPPPSGAPSAAGAAPAAPALCSELVAEAWAAVDSVYLDPGFNGVDWAALRPGPETRCAEATPHAQVRGLLARLGDPAVRLVPAAGVAAFMAEMMAEAHVGVGLRELLSVDVDERTGLLTVVTPVPGGPAARAGLRTGDVIRSVGGVRSDTMDLALAMARLRGEKDSKVELVILRDGAPRSVTLARERIDPPGQAELRMREGPHGAPIAYLRVADFSAGMAGALRARLGRPDVAAASGMVLDLRDNPGGLVQELTAAAELFLGPGTPIATVVSRPGAGTALAASQPALTDKPLVVLVNRGSASAAEALAGALQAGGRAVVVGQPTFRKGLAHFASALSDGSLVLAPMGRLETPHGRDILDEGIAPDVRVPAPPLTELVPRLDDDAAFAAAAEILVRSRR